MASGIYSLNTSSIDDSSNNEDAPDSSADRDAWLALSGKIMDQLSKIIPMMEVMKNVSDMHAIVEASWTAFALHRQAMLLDKVIELELSRSMPD